MEGQARLIAVLNPMIRGWSSYFSTVCSKRDVRAEGRGVAPTAAGVDQVAPSNKHRKWGQQRYWRREGGGLHFTPRGGGRRLACHSERPIRRHVKGQARRSPYDGDEELEHTAGALSGRLQARVHVAEEASGEMSPLRILCEDRRRAGSGPHHLTCRRGERYVHELATVASVLPRGEDGARASTVCLTSTTRLRSRVRWKLSCTVLQQRWGERFPRLL